MQGGGGSRRGAVLVLGAGLALGAAGAAPAAAAGAVPGCDRLTAARLTGTADGIDLDLTVPVALSGRPLAAGDVTATSAGGPVAVRVDPVPLRDVGVAVVLLPAAAGATDPDASALGVVEAARELLLQLPAGVSTAVVDGRAGAAVLSPLSRDRAAAVGSLTRPAGAGAGDAPQALALAVRQAQRTGAGHVVLIGDPAGVRSDGASPVVVHRLGAWGDRAPADPAGDGCPAPATGLSLIAQGDAVVARLRAQYHVHLDAAAPVTVRVAADGVQAAVEVPGEGAAQPGPSTSTPPDPPAGTAPASPAAAAPAGPAAQALPRSGQGGLSGAGAAGYAAGSALLVLAFLAGGRRMSRRVG